MLQYFLPTITLEILKMLVYDVNDLKMMTGTLILI